MTYWYNCKNVYYSFNQNLDDISFTKNQLHFFVWQNIIQIQLINVDKCIAPRIDRWMKGKWTNNFFCWPLRAKYDLKTNKFENIDEYLVQLSNFVPEMVKYKKNHCSNLEIEGGFFVTWVFDLGRRDVFLIAYIEIKAIFPRRNTSHIDNDPIYCPEDAFLGFFSIKLLLRLALLNFA